MSQTPTNYFLYTSPLGWSIELPSFTCGHCNRMYAPQPRADFRSREEIEWAINSWLDKTAPTYVTCRSCDGLICLPCSDVQTQIVNGRCNAMDRSAELAMNETLGQPWLLRGLRADGGDAGEPVLRVDGQLALAKDVGYTNRAMARQRRN